MPLGALLVLVLLAGGIWLGGHPDVPARRVRDTLVGDDDAQLYDEAADIIARDYYRKVDRKQLLDKSLGSAVESLDDRFSTYFDPKDYKSFQEATEGALRGRRHERRGGPDAGCASSPSSRARRPPRAGSSRAT